MQEYFLPTKLCWLLIPFLSFTAALNIRGGQCLICGKFRLFKGILAFNSGVPGNSSLLGGSGGGFILQTMVFFSLMDGPSSPGVLAKLSFIITQQKEVEFIFPCCQAVLEDIDI